MRDRAELKSHAFEGPHGVATIKSADGDSQRFEAAQDVVQERLLLEDGEAPNALGQLGEQGQHLNPGKIHADAGVRPSTEAQVISGAPQHIEPIGVGILALVSVCCP